MLHDLPPNEQNATSAGMVSGVLEERIGQNITQEVFNRFPSPDQGITIHPCTCGNFQHSFKRLGDVAKTVLLRLEGKHHATH